MVSAEIDKTYITIGQLMIIYVTHIWLPTTALSAMLQHEKTLH